MKAKSKLKVLTISSVLYLGLILSPSFVYADKYSNAGHSHSKVTAKHKNNGHYKRSYKPKKRHARHKYSRYNKRHSHSRSHQLQRRQVVRHYPVWDRPVLNINFGNEHSDFTYRDF
jgi:hypothetical protein